MSARLDHLVARTRRLDADVDLLAFAGRDGVLFERGRAGLAGRGCAARIPWPGGDRDPASAATRVSQALAPVEVDDQVGLPGCGAVAFGALPFAASAPSELVVPAVLAGRSEDGARWLTTIDRREGGTDRPPPPLAAPDERLPPVRRFTVAAQRHPDDWCDLVERATKVMAGGAFAKVVLARQIDVEADRPLDRLAVLGRLRSAYPGCHVVAVDGFVAASPELLVSRAGDIVRSHPMAGTAPRGGDPTTDQRLAASLLASTKDRQEHQITIDMVHDTLLPWCSYLDYEAEPSVVAVANVQHLATLVEGRLSQPAPSVLELAAALHPTPAVAGWPRDEAVAWIAENEGFDRRRYAGTCGWVDATGNGAWAVSVRCAEIDGTAAHVWAGNGIVADSDPPTELAETRAKLQALLAAIVRP
ncbi:MAG TPA: isochorismate synthase [Acidimicrobiales bacterium]|nr:isochorismate synthase [Acidimicrobiales bacterium]